MMTHCLRPILLGGVLLMASACASEDYNTWVSHPTHYASGSHMGFSARTVGATRVKVTPEDIALAQKEQWWGRGVTGMLDGSMMAGSGVPPTAVSGFWSGGWVGQGLSTERRGPVVAEFVINPDGYGKGFLAVLDTEAVEGVPRTLRHAGTFGVAVWVKVEGNVVMIAEAQSAGAFDPRFTAEFAAEGDRLTGRFRTVSKDYRNSLGPVRMSLVRQP